MSHRGVAGAICFGALLLGCGEDEPFVEGDAPWTPPAEFCNAPEGAARFGDCTLGSGRFGRWIVDERGYPAFDYRADQHADPLASYPVTEVNADGLPLDPRTHWAAFGNRRINAMLSNDGTVEVVTQDRGVEYLIKVDESQNAFGGGFSYVRSDGEGWCSAYKYRPRPSLTERRFGMGYAQTSTQANGVRVARRMASPAGSDAVVVSDVTLTNVGDTDRSFSHYEYWDVARRAIEINWLVSGQAFTHVPQSARDERDDRNALFDETVSYDASARRLEVRRDWASNSPRLSPEEPSPVDHHPPDPFLVAAIGEVSDVFVDKAAFFGSGNANQPETVQRGPSGMGTTGGVLSSANALGQPHVLVVRSDISLAPGESKRLRFVYGYARAGQEYPEDLRWRDPTWDASADYQTALEPKLMNLELPDHPELVREMAWHSYQIETSVGYRDYWQQHVVPQGSAYLYLHGADGAARDLGLFAQPLIYTDPELAKSELRFFMGIQKGDDSFSYAFQGHGMLDDASLHSAPSDLPLFFLWALGEYLGATGDLAFWSEAAPYHPRESRPGATVWDHTVGAVRHMFDVVGTGEHGLIGIGTGDWSDGIVIEAPDRALAVAKGESVPNTQMAVAVLPRIADLVEDRDPALATEIRSKVQGYRGALEKVHNKDFFYRAYFGDGKPAYADVINLEAQVWALIGDSTGSQQLEENLLARIESELEAPSAIGATLLPGAQVWPAISALLTWGYAKRAPERAFPHFARNTLAAHAVAFPEVWYGVWSAPDGVESSDGTAWASPVTPMTDFPTQNNNAHAMPLLAALRVFGVDAHAEGVVIHPPSVTPARSMDTALLQLTLGESSLSGEYRPTGKSPRKLTLEPPPRFSFGKVQTNGSVTETTPMRVVIAAPSGGSATSFSAALQPSGS
ncbi:MAG: hypothetical protein R3B13_34410 [Polyangiaceae bacterium]